MTNKTAKRNEVKVSGNGNVQHHPYNPKMNDAAWKPMFWYKHERKEES